MADRKIRSGKLDKRNAYLQEFINSVIAINRPRNLPIRRRNPEPAAGDLGIFSKVNTLIHIQARQEFY